MQEYRAASVLYTYSCGSKASQIKLLHAPDHGMRKKDPPKVAEHNV